MCFKEIGKDLSVSCIDFLLKCLEKDPAKRLTPAEALVHPWIVKNMIFLMKISLKIQYFIVFNLKG